MGEKTGARCVHEIIVLNHSTQKYFLDTYGRTTHYIPNGVNPAAPDSRLIICTGHKDNAAVSHLYQMLGGNVRTFNKIWIHSVHLRGWFKPGEKHHRETLGPEPFQSA